MGNGNKLTSSHLCYKFIAYFIDKHIFCEWKCFTVLNEQAAENKFIIFKNKNRIFCYPNYVLAIAVKLCFSKIPNKFY